MKIAVASFKIRYSAVGFTMAESRLGLLTIIVIAQLQIGASLHCHSCNGSIMCIANERCLHAKQCTEEQINYCKNFKSGYEQLGAPNCPHNEEFNIETKRCLTPEQKRLLPKAKRLLQYPPENFVCLLQNAFANPYNCKEYYICTSNYQPLKFSCPLNTHFNGWTCESKATPKCKPQNNSKDLYAMVEILRMSYTGVGARMDKMAEEPVSDSFIVGLFHSIKHVVNGALSPITGVYRKMKTICAFNSIIRIKILDYICIFF